MSDTPIDDGVPQNVDKAPLPEDGEQPTAPVPWNDDEGDPQADIMAEAQRIMDGV